MAFTTDTLPVLANWSQFISGFTIIGGLLTVLRHINCHQKRCLRLGRYDLPGTPYRKCRKHHPDVPS